MADSKWRWQPPNSSEVPVMMYNTCTRSKDEFVPRFKGHVNWYSCGPTVYAPSHLGHARSYITFDILRRIMADYFGYNVNYVMNITDIDDKIIVRARQTHLFEQYRKAERSAEELLQQATDATATYKAKGETTDDEGKRKLISTTSAKAEIAIQAFKADPSNAKAREALLDACQDPLSAWLDEEQGSTITEHSIFTKLTQRFEAEFFADMAALNVRKPNILTRVTEYVPEIVSFVEQIIRNGFAYEANGSVYFDSPKYAASEGRAYPKLVPEASQDVASLADGEGSLSTSDGEKKSPYDFALWKASKPGEPEWDSPWGKGRPGWHIECSAMCHAAFEDKIDIHTGGVDLCFPHHDNEIAQSEAFYLDGQWCNYFLHSGHLTIAGLKMSKSLKNFISIREALAKHTASQLRLVFLTHGWNATLDYSESGMAEVLVLEKQFKEFFLNVKALLAKAPTLYLDLEIADFALLDTLEDARKRCHLALCDNFDTATVMNVLRELVSSYNVYVKEAEAAKRSPHGPACQQLAEYMTQMLKMFGLFADDDAIGFPVTNTATLAEAEEQAQALQTEMTTFFATVGEVAASLSDVEKGEELTAIVAQAARELGLEV
eukprot:TRINITY_DN10948_c0_g1_i1.p1 TRINITY_DN10948_c0_g1~~TRINITY_DN10948_c0_g1_i1.p1  ORF type:complete len:606 (+),score=150.26 TRINITY_DN10948_c0_g1_i1:19-1836(+)